MKSHPFWLLLSVIICLSARPPQTDPYALYDMVSLQGGGFYMGDVMGDSLRKDEIVHKVTLSGFRIARFEVTIGQMAEILGNTYLLHRDTCRNCPATYVSWDNAQTFIQKLNEKYPGAKFRLPTEAEWEYAAREWGKKVRFGDGSDTLSHERVNFGNCADPTSKYCRTTGHRSKIIPTGSLKPNAVGLYDMTGNVFEWVHDRYEKYLIQPAHNPKGSETGPTRVIKGGCYLSNPEISRVAFRHHEGPTLRFDHVGFRLAAD